MAAAVVRTCVVCEAASSKYKCPSCSSPTCSLACSKAHKALRHEAASEGVATSANGKGTRQEAPAPVIRANGQEIQPPPSGYAATTSYVPLSSYDDRQLLKDFEYLQHVGRSVQEVGRELTKQQWFSPDMVTGQTPDPRASQQQQSQQQGYLGKGKGREAHHHQQQLSVGQRRRQALDSTIRRGRWPIMLLPEGMQMRRENRTQWKNGKMAFTVEVRSCQSSSERASRWRTLLHQINGEERVHDVVLDQLVKRTKNLLPKKARKAGASKEARYMISDAAWQQAGLSPPNKGTISSNDEDDNREPKPYDALPAWCEIVVAVHSDRLRNETSAKFLGWWKRQVKNGLVGPDGLELVKPKEEDREGAEIDFSEASIAIPTAPRSERGGDGGNSNVGAQIERKAEEAGVPVPAGLGSLLSSGLLSRLHEQMNKGNNKPADASTGTPADGAAIDRPSKEELSKIMSRTIVVAADETQTIKGLVREVGSRGLAIVEYPCLELWDAKSLRKDVAKKGTEVVELASNDLKRKRKRIDEEISDDEDASAAPRHPAAKRQLPAPAKPVGIIGLSAYDSSDEGSDEAETEGTARNREDTTGEEEEGDVDAGGMASIARAMGWIPAEPQEEAKAKDNLPQEAKDGEELDWGDED